MLDATGHLKLADFGSAKDLREAARPVPDGMRANILTGTAEYISPEVRPGSSADHWIGPARVTGCMGLAAYNCMLLNNSRCYGCSRETPHG